MFGKVAEIAGEYLRKGSQVYIEGRLRTDRWTDDKGETHYTTRVVARGMQILDRKPEEQEVAAEGDQREIARSLAELTPDLMASPAPSG